MFDGSDRDWNPVNYSSDTHEWLKKSLRFSAIIKKVTAGVGTHSFKNKLDDSSVFQINSRTGWGNPKAGI